MASITDGLFAGRAGIQSHGSAIGVLADNIANSNTTAFKASRPDFTDLLAGTIGGGGTGSVTVGSGSTLSSITTVFNQGTFEFTGRALDLAIDGNGFFIVEDDLGTRFFSRAGNFTVDAAGDLRNQTGLKVVGFPENGTGTLEAINLNTLAQGSVDTTAVTITGNLNASSDVTTAPDDDDDPTFAELSAAASYSTFVDVFDSLGDTHPVTVFFFNGGAGEWEVKAYVDGSEVDGTPGLPSLIGSSTIEFGPDGTRTTIPASDFTVDAAWANGSNAGEFTMLFSPFTQFSSASAITSITQDGSGSGSVVSFSVEKDGTLFALLDNGQTSNIGKIGLATFANPEGLQRIGNSLFLNSGSSGEAVIGTPRSGKFGSIEAGALELSTADIASDFIKLISLQRGFQGSSRIITNIDNLLNEIINLA